MTVDDFPPAPAARPLWLVTLADLGLLLVGFLVLLQATHDRAALARGLRAGFAETPAAMPVAAAALTGFAPGSAALPGGTDAVAAWARDAARDPRVEITVTGVVDGSRVDVDAATGSPALLAADRARAAAALLARAAPGVRLRLSTDRRPRTRAVSLTLAFAGETH